ncbi:MAG: hypothetical protein Q9O24_06440 [Gammaproteobacteria bacterium]|nr:hypothetical protein [Gammaproteobacteria bacterium]
MKNIVQHILVPAYKTYQMHGLRTAAPIAIVWLSGLVTMVQGLHTLSELTAGLGLSLWIVSQALGLLATSVPSHKTAHINNTSYSEDPLAMVQATMGHSTVRFSYRRYLKLKASAVLRKGLNSNSFPSCPVAY